MFPFPSHHIESLSSSTKPFTAKPKSSFLLRFNILAIQHGMKEPISLTLKHDCEIPEPNTNLIKTAGNV